MNSLSFFKPKTDLRNGEFFSFIGDSLFCMNKFVYTGNDRPDEVRSVTNATVLQEAIGQLVIDYEELNKTLRYQRSFIESKEMNVDHQMRIDLFSSVKKRIYGQETDIDIKSEIATAATSLRYIIDSFSNLQTKTRSDISGLLTNLINILKNETNLPKITLLNLTKQIDQLEEVNNKYIALYLKRGVFRANNVVSAMPSRKKCIVSYENIINIYNSLITLDKETNFSPLIEDINGIQDNYRLLLSTRRKTIKENDRPDEVRIVPPLITGPVE